MNKSISVDEAVQMLKSMPYAFPRRVRGHRGRFIAQELERHGLVEQNPTGMRGVYRVTSKGEAWLDSPACLDGNTIHEHALNCRGAPACPGG